ncbi:phage holin family protein [Luteimonas sp. RD2P54]|uniref:Phage holin family protein n=1 Tax=Luteimonas endophytica TaxID=3042023 RepID=A0ABT6JDP3_9GAMM|nr:phage holin family protein [Luteimonas endophytica]MDH5824936.1 phage holin family protein [Luteimonas endophytica]
MTEQPRDQPGAPAGGDAGAGKPPHLDESVRRVGKAGRALLGSGRETGRALRKLVAADLALARGALGRALFWAAVGIIFGASAWLLVMGATVAVLQAAGLSWLASIAIAAGISLAVTGLAAWRVFVYFEMATLKASRRQLARLGLFDEGPDDDEDGDPPAPRSHAVPAAGPAAAAPPAPTGGAVP